MIYNSLEFARKAVELRLDLLNDVSLAIAQAEQKKVAVNCRQLLHSRLISVDSMKNWPFICCFYCLNLWWSLSDLGKQLEQSESMGGAYRWLLAKTLGLVFVENIRCECLFIAIKKCDLALIYGLIS